MNEWISVKNKLPIQMPENFPTFDWVLVTTDYFPHPITIARWDGKKWDFLDTNDSWTYAACNGDCTNPIDEKDISYWMPLPKPPRKIMNEFGKTLEITGEVQYIGDGEDPKDNVGFQIWARALKAAYEESNKEKFDKETHDIIMNTYGNPDYLKE